jgi:hypothetical protein
VFTPPQVYYSAAAARFTVTPPGRVVEPPSREPFGVELIGVRAEPLPLQLIGFAGGENHWTGTFENIRTGEIFLGRAGRAIGDLGWTIMTLEVQRVAVPMGDSTSVQRVAKAIVRDEAAQREYLLSSHARTMSETLTAAILVAGEADSRELRVGGEFSLGEVHYRVEAIGRAPESIVVTKQSPSLPEVERRILHPRNSAPDALANAGN